MSRLAWWLYKCAALWRTVYGDSATERPLGTIHKEKEISSRLHFGVYLPSFLVTSLLVICAIIFTTWNIYGKVKCVLL